MKKDKQYWNPFYIDKQMYYIYFSKKRESKKHLSKIQLSLDKLI